MPAQRSEAAEQVLEKINALLPEIEQRAQATEDLRRIPPDETVSSLETAGFFRLMQPEQWGGYQVDPVTFYEAVRRIASACGSTGWVSGIIGIHNWHLALFDQQAQEDVWGKDTNVRISSSYAPMGMGEVVDGGYKVNGSWAWSSGCDTADWVFVGGPVIKNGKPVDFVSFLIPREDYTIKDVWNVVGLRGTGSNTIEVKDVFVPPRHRMLSMRTMSMGAEPGPRAEHRAGIQDALGHNPPEYHRDADRRHGLRRLPCSRRTSGEACPRRLRRGRRPRTIRSPRSGSPRPPATSTPHGDSCRATCRPNTT